MSVAVNHLSVILVSQDALQSVQISQALGAFSPLLSVQTPEHSLDACQQAQSAVVILDMRRGEETLFDWIGCLRQSHPATGLICITEFSRLNDKLRALRCGADHVLTSPWQADELSAMLDNLEQRLTANDMPAASVVAQDFVLQLDTGFRVLRGPQSEQALSRSEFLLLVAFAKAPQHQLEIWEIYDVLQKNEDNFPKQALEAQIYRLRKKIRDSGAGKQILKAIRLQGYQLCNPIKIN